MPSPGCFSPAWLFAPVSLTRSPVSKPPPCFSRSILYNGAPLPSTGSPRAAYPGVFSTIRALRLLCRIRRRLLIRSPAPTHRLLVRSLAAETSARAWPRFLARRRQLLGLVEHRFSQVPGESIPYLCPALRPRSV